MRSYAHASWKPTERNDPTTPQLGSPTFVLPSLVVAHIAVTFCCATMGDEEARTSASGASARMSVDKDVIKEALVEILQPSRPCQRGRTTQTRRVHRAVHPGETSRREGTRVMGERGRHDKQTGARAKVSRAACS